MRAGREKQQLCWAPCGCGTAILPAPQGAVTVGAAMGCSIPQRQCLPPSTHPPVQHKASAPTASSLLKMGTVWLAPSKPGGFPSFPRIKSPVKAGPGLRQAAESFRAAQLCCSHMATGPQRRAGGRTRRHRQNQRLAADYSPAPSISGHWTTLRLVLLSCS